MVVEVDGKMIPDEVKIDPAIAKKLREAMMRSQMLPQMIQEFINQAEREMMGARSEAAHIWAELATTYGLDLTQHAYVLMDTDDKLVLQNVRVK